MRFRNTAILLIVLAALAGFAYFSDVRGKSESTPTPSAEARELQVLDLKTDEVSALEIKANDSTVKVARGEGGLWQLVAPEAAEADQGRVGMLVGQLTYLRAERKIADRVENLAEFGLDQPSYLVTLELVGGKKEVLKVGSDNPRGTSSYLQREGADTVFLVPALGSSLKGVIANPPKATPTPTPTSTPSPASTPVP